MNVSEGSATGGRLFEKGKVTGSGVLYLYLVDFKGESTPSLAADAVSLSAPISNVLRVPIVVTD
jgi:hypothetical protein